MQRHQLTLSQHRSRRTRRSLSCAGLPDKLDVLGLDEFPDFSPRRRFADERVVHIDFLEGNLLKPRPQYHFEVFRLTPQI